MNARVIDHQYTLEDYHQDREYLSKTLLSKLADNPQRFKFAQDGGRSVETAPQRMGSAAHLMMSDPDGFNSAYYIMPDKTPDGKEFKRDKRHTAYKAVLQAAGNRTVLKESEVISVLKAGDALKANPTSAPLLSGQLLYEQTILWERSNGIKLKTRPDVIRLDDDTAIDLKTSASAAPESFFRIAYDKHYDLSVALTAEGFQEAFGRPLRDYLFVVIELAEPFIIEVYSGMQQMKGRETNYLQFGQVKLEELLDLYQECASNDHWPSYNQGIVPMEIPDWKMRQFEKRLDEELMGWEDSRDLTFKERG